AAPRRSLRRTARYRVGSGAGRGRDLRRGEAVPACVCVSTALGLGFGGFGGRVTFRRRRRRQVLLLDPAGLDAGLHDQRFGLFAGEIEAVENPGVLHGLAVLALGPTDQIVGNRAGQILDRLDPVLAHVHQHLGGNARDLLERVLDAELLALFVELVLLLVE